MNTRPVPTRTVIVQQVIETSVEVFAEEPEIAVKAVDQRSFPLPPRDEWEVIKGTRYIVLDDHGNTIYEEG